MSDKPEYLFHGTTNRNISTFVPREQDNDINGKFPAGIKRHLVFATANENFAALYSLKTPHMLSTSNHGGANTAFIRDQEAWKRELGPDGGAVYVLPSATFTNTLSKHDGKPTVEWTSPSEVTPLRIKNYSPEDVMRTGAQLFALTPEISKVMWHYDKDAPSDTSFQNRLQARMNSGAITQDFTPMHIARELRDAGLLVHMNAQAGIEAKELPKSSQASAIQEDVRWLKEQVRLAHLASAVTIPQHVIAPEGTEAKLPLLAATKNAER